MAKAPDFAASRSVMPERVRLLILGGVMRFLGALRFSAVCVAIMAATILRGSKDRSADHTGQSPLRLSFGGSAQREA